MSLVFISHIDSATFEYKLRNCYSKINNLFFFVVKIQSRLVSTIKTIIHSPHYLLFLLPLELGGLSRQRGLTIIVHYISDNNDIIPCPHPLPRNLTYWHRKRDGVKHIIISLENVFYYFNSLPDILYVF